MSSPAAEFDYATPPGEVLAEWLEENGVSQVQLARNLGKSAKFVNQIVNGVAVLSAQTATELETVTGVSARLWAQMEACYRADLARLRRDESLAKETAWLDELPMRALITKGHVEKYEDKVQGVLAALRFFGVPHVSIWRDLWQAPSVAFRECRQAPAQLGARAAWLRIGELEAQLRDTAPFSGVALESRLEDIKALSREPEGAKISPSIVALCAEAGVVVVFVPEIAGARVYGATRWISGRPIVQLSLRRKTDDQFWFTLFHEFAHVLLHGRGTVFVEDLDCPETDPDVVAQELEANQWAGNLLIPDSMVPELRKIKSLAEVQRFASRVGVSAGVVVGRMHHDKIRPYSWGARLKRRVAFG